MALPSPPFRPASGWLSLARPFCRAADKRMRIRAGVVLGGIAALLRIGATAAYSQEAPETKSDQYHKLDSAFSDRIEAFEKMYGAIQKRLLTAVHYEKKTTDAGVSRTEEAWINELDQLLKVSVERTSPAGSQLTEYFYDSDRIILVQRHNERPAKDGPPDVQVEKFLYGQTELDNMMQPRIAEGIQRVTMSKWVEGQESVRDTPPGLPGDEPLSAGKPGAQALAILEKLVSAGPPKYDPAAGPEAQKYRLIMDSVSPDGHYALAFGLAQEKINWEEHRDAKRGGYVADTDTGAKREVLRNYVVDLKTSKILGETGCRYSRTRSKDGQEDRDGHKCYTVWSDGSETFVQTVLEQEGAQKYYACRVGRIVDGRLLPTVDAGAPAAKVARSFATQKRWKIPKDQMFNVDLGSYKDVYVSFNEIALTIDGVSESGGNDIKVSFALKVTGNVLTLEALPGAKEVQVERGTPYYAEQALNAEDQENVEKKKALLEKRRRLLLESQAAETPKK
jgi:hypothetical protein